MMDPTWRRLIKTSTRSLVALGVLVSAALVYYLLARSASQPALADPDAALPRVVVLAAKRMPVQRQWQGYGTAEASDSANVPARVTATVVQVPEAVADGMPVTRGQLLVKLDDSDFSRQVEIARQNLLELAGSMALLEIERKRLAERLELYTQDVALAQSELDRVTDLKAQNVSSSREIDHAQRSLIAARSTHLLTAELLEKIEPQRLRLQAQQEALRSSAQLAEQNLQRCSIVSPLDGVLQSVDVEVGENVVPGQRVARVVDLRRVELPLRLPTAARVDVAVGDQVILTATNQTGLTWSARLSRIAPEDDAATRTITVFVEVDQSQAVARWAEDSDGDQPNLLTPGMFVAGVVTSGRAQQRWVVPRRSVRDGRLFLVAGNMIRSRQVRIDFLFEGDLPGFGLADDQWAVLDADPGAEALADGDLVLVNASTSVLEGDRVEPALRASAQTAARLASPQPVGEGAP